MSRAFTKLFSSITESTVWCEPLATRIVWITMLAMADRQGRVFASIPGLANRARVEVEEAEQAILRFLEPDRYSRTPDHEGRRIEPIDGGWRLLNYAKYREMRDEEARREYQREWDQTRRRRPTQSDKSDKIRPQPTQAEAEAEAEAVKASPSPNGEGVSSASPTTTGAAKVDCPHAELIGIWHKVMPELATVQLARWPGSKSETNLRNRWREGLAARTGWWRFETHEQGLAKFTELLETCRDSEFLMGKTSQAGRQPFRLDLHWLLKRDNFDKVLNNRYHQGAAA